VYVLWMPRFVLLLTLTSCAAAQVAPPSRPRHHSEPTPASTARHDRHILALQVGGAGAIALTVGALAAVDARRLRDKAQLLGCTDDLSRCPAGSALTTAENAHSRGNFATGFFVGGGLVMAAGLALWFTAPSDDQSWRVAPSGGASGGGVTLSRGF
jgi:hypothetical protein